MITTGIYPLDKENMPGQIDSLDIQNDDPVDLIDKIRIRHQKY
jgi:hypothetical protein